MECIRLLYGIISIPNMKHIESILALFKVPESVYNFQAHHQGLINQTYIVSNNDKVEFVLQRINDGVFKDMPALMFNLTSVLPYLSAEDYSEIEYIRTRQNQQFLEHESGTWRLMKFIENSKVFETSSDPEIAFEAGRIVARFHELTSSIDSNSFQEVIPKFHNIQYRLAQFDEAMIQAIPERKDKAKELLQFIHANMDFILSVDPQKMPQRICHNDTKLNNILFSKDDKALCLIDLDTIMPGSTLFDLGDILRTLVNPAAENEIDQEKIEFSIEMYRHFLRGLFQNIQTLSEIEIKAIPWSVVYMPFLHGLRALTDYLMGDQYYTVNYVDENLDRSRSLLRVSSLGIENQDEMNRLLNDYL